MALIPFLRAQVSRRLPTPVNFREQAVLELDGFSEFASEVTPEQDKEINKLALKIVKSNNTNDPIFAFRVEGHSDIIRRTIDAKGGAIDARERKFLQENVSKERASTGFELLVEALKKKGGEDFAKRIAKESKHFGLGTQRLKIPNATNEAQFRQNRRVVFIIRQVTFIPPPPEPPKPPSSIIEERFSVRLLNAAVLSISPVTGVESTSVNATLEITDLIDKKRVRFQVVATGGGFSLGPTKVGGSLSFTPGPEVKFKIFRLIGGRAPIINLQSFEGLVTIFINPSITTESKSEGGVLSFSFDALESSGVNTQPQVIRVPGGNTSLGTPGVSAPLVLPLGGMRMIGSPTNL